jgi:hypothetical protein
MGDRMNREFLKLTAFYTAGVVVVLYLMWVLLSLALPEAHLNVIHALSTAFGINLPDDIFVSTGSGVRAIAVIFIISALSIGLIVLNVFFGAVITTHFIRPRVNVLTSSYGVLSATWNSAMPYVLVRLSNFHKHELADVRLSVVLTVQETREITGGTEDFMATLPVEHFTPQRILVMRPKMPWTIAVPGDALLSSSLTKDYHFKPGEPIEKSFSKDKKILYVRRTLEILIQGIDTKSYAEFVLHRKILIDEQQGENYFLRLHRGAFKSLPLQITNPADLEECVD